MKNNINKLKKKYPNDRELGSHIRSEYQTIIVEINDVLEEININQKYPNDSSLGIFIRYNIIIS